MKCGRGLRVGRQWHSFTRPGVREGVIKGPLACPFHESIQVALWDLAAKQVNMSLGKFLGCGRDKAT